MELIYLTAVGIALYVFSDFLLRRAEAIAGRRFEQRSLIFFGILLASALVVFALIRRML